MAYKKNKNGTILLQGLRLTVEEQNAYKKSVNNANAKRTRQVNKLYEKAKDTPFMKGISKKEYEKQLEKKGFITERYSSSFKNLKSRKDFKSQLEELQAVNKKYYGEDKISKLRNSMMKKAKQNLGDNENKVYNKIKNLTNAQLVNIYIHNDDIVANVYGSNQKEDLDEKIESTTAKLDKAIKVTKPKTTTPKGKKKSSKRKKN